MLSMWGCDTTHELIRQKWVTLSHPSKLFTAGRLCLSNYLRTAAYVTISCFLGGNLCPSNQLSPAAYVMISCFLGGNLYPSNQLSRAACFTISCSWKSLYPLKVVSLTCSNNNANTESTLSTTIRHHKVNINIAELCEYLREIEKCHQLISACS